MSGQVWLSGRFVAADRARVSVSSRALTHGEGVFETLRVVKSHAPLAALHAARLATACHTLGIAPPDEDWDAVIHGLAERNRQSTGVARITLSHDFVLVTLAALPRGLAAQRQSGIGLESVRIRWGVAAIKSTSRLPLVLAEGPERDEVLLRGERGQLLETSRSNFFAVTDSGAVETAPSPSVLPGIARGLVVELARGFGACVRLKAPRAGNLGRVHEAFVTNAVRGVRPVHSIDGTTIGVRPDSLTFRLQKAIDQRMGL